MTRIFLILMALVAGLLSYAPPMAPATPAHAHGADWEVRVIGERVGGYDVTVRTEPKQPQVGRLHVEVQLINPQDLTYVGDATVTATAQPLEGGGQSVGPEPAIYHHPWYEMDIRLRDSGPWEVRVNVDGPRGSAETAFSIDVAPGDSLTLLGLPLPLGLGLVAAVLGGFLVVALLVWNRGYRKLATSTSVPAWRKNGGGQNHGTG